MLENIAMIVMVFVIFCIMYDHDTERKIWNKERAELLDRIQSVDYVSFKTIAKPKEKVEKEKPKPPDLV